MEGRSILLAKLSVQSEELGEENVLISPSLKHILIWTRFSKITLHSLSKQSDYEHKGTFVLWSETFCDVESVTFSNDGKQFAFLSKSQTKKIILYNITEQAVIKYSEAFLGETGQPSSRITSSIENLFDASTVSAEPEILLRLHKSHVVVYSSGLLSCFHMSTSNEAIQNYCVNLAPGIMCFHYNTNFFYCLDDSGILYVYIMESGFSVGVYNIYKVLPKNLGFCQICVNATGSQVALLGDTNHVYILNISLAVLTPAFPHHHQFSARGSSTSVSSFKTSTSKTSNFSRVDSLRREATVKKIASAANSSTASKSWLGYLEKLTNRKKNNMGKVEECGAFICIRDIPKMYSIRNLHFCQDSLGIWASHYDGISDGFYRIYDTSSGQLESLDILAPDVKVILMDSSSVCLDLFLQSSNLYLPLGVVSRDTLIQKMVGGENESQVDEMIGHAVLPLPLLQEGLTHQQLDMVRLALNLHTQGFKSKLNEDNDEVLEELTISTKQLFEKIHTAVEKSDSSGQWNQQIRRLALTHANTLLSLLLSPSSQASLQVKILEYVVILRRGEILLPVDVPVIPQWTSWLSISDEDVILHSIDSLCLVQSFLALHRGWSQEDLQGRRFYNIVQCVLTNLLQEKQLEQASQLLTKLNLDPEQELQTVCLNLQDCSLRDYLVTKIKLKSEHYDAWKFLTLFESVLNKYKNSFPEFIQSPLKISDVLSLSLNDRSRIIADLYFSTNEQTLEVHLDKHTCWNYLLNHNSTEGILVWITGESKSTNFSWPLRLFSQWNIEQSMVDNIVSSDCTDLTKHIVCNKLASFGIFTSDEKSDPKKLVTRMALSGVFPDVEGTLGQRTANLSYSQFCNIMFQHAIQNNLVELAVKCDLSDIDCDSECPDWLRLFKLHSLAGKTWDQSDVAQAVQETTQYLACLESVSPDTYLKQHPIVAIVTDTLKGQDIRHLYSHVSPLLAASVPVSPATQDDITLYSVLSHTVPFHTDNIFQHQINSKKNSRLPDFSNENLSLRYGMHYSLGLKEFLMQGRPASAVSFIFQKGRFSVRKKMAVNTAHGLALCNAHNPMVTSSCIAFAELLGQDSSLLRTHIATARTLVNHISDNKLKELLLHLVKGKDGGAPELLSELERFFLNKWTAKGSCDLTCLQDFHLAVQLSVYHSLPAPSALLKHALKYDNWVLFILAAQLFQYPLTAVQEISTSSANHEISRHLFYALQGSVKNQEESGAVKMFEPETNLISCLAHFGNNAEKLFALSRKLNSPALALCASSLQQHSVETGLSMWLIASMLPEEDVHCPKPPWTPDAVTQLLEQVVKKGYIYTLAQGMFIFQPVNPLCALAKFLINCVGERKFEESTSNLQLFLAAFLSLPNEAMKEASFLKSKRWISVTAYRIVCTALAYCFPSGYFRRCFLKVLCDAQFCDVHQDGQSLPLFLRLSECLADTPLQLDWKRLCLQNDFSQLSELLDSLTEQHMFDTAFKFAHIAGLPSDQVLVTQWSVLANSDETKDFDFWQKCDTAFQQSNIVPDIAVKFYRNQVETCNDLHERYVLLKSALLWMYKNSSNKEDIRSLQIELYMTCLEENFKTEVITEGVVPAPLHCLSTDLVLTQMSSPPQLCSIQHHRLDTIIHQLLVIGDIETAFLLQSLFHHTNQDCELLLASMRLAEGAMIVSQLPSRIQDYLADDTARRPKTPFTSLIKRQSRNSISQSDNNIILNALYALQAHQVCPTGLFGNVICGFKISVALDCNYKDVILDSEPLNRLTTDHGFDVATSLLNLASLTRSECTQYICSQIVTVLSSEPVNGRYFLWGCDLETEFSSILELSGSALLLGNLLLASDTPLSSSSLPSTYRQVVELLILAHNCFTRVCHMEGIASVLNSCRSLVNRLLDCCQWPLMVRLLTRIGRYTEMNYIFQILKDNDQFEFLLGKGLDKYPQLMSATLEFVRCDKELFSLVAHHFSMYSELAVLYEGEAHAELEKVERVDGKLAVTAQNKSCLQTSMSKYTYATEHYMQAKKMKCGVSSIQQAELIAIQLSLLTNTTDAVVPCLINLTKNEALKLVSTVLSCEQAHIVASAYNISVDWGEALYYNCIRRGDTSYLNTWTRHHQLNKTVVQDVVRRFQNERELNSTMEVNMKWFVSSVSLLDVKYRVASQLGFKDILQSLLSNPDMAYLKDTVWQSGFKKQLL